MSPETLVDIATSEEIQTAVTNALDDLGLTFEELRQQAESGRFGSEKARMVWFAIRDLAPAA